MSNRDERPPYSPGPQSSAKGTELLARFDVHAKASRHRATRANVKRPARPRRVTIPEGVKPDTKRTRGQRDTLSQKASRQQVQQGHARRGAGRIITQA